MKLQEESDDNFDPFEISVMKYFLKLSPINLFTVLIFLAALIISILTIFDFYSNDNGFSSSSILETENAQYKIRVQETKFREKLLSEISKSSLESSFNTLDSISITPKGIDDIKKVLVLNQLRSNTKKYQFKINVDKSTSPLVEITDLRITFEVDFDRLNNILKSSNFKTINENIKYGNFIKTKYLYNKKLRIDYLIIAILIVLSFAVISYFSNRIGHKSTDGTIEKKQETLNSDNEFLDRAKKSLNDKSITTEKITQIESFIEELKNKIKLYDATDILESILYQDALKIERKSNELYNRSTLMLILGLLVAIAGILIFYFTLPNFSDIKNNSDYIALAIRPTLILLFIQSISFYLLKQYRTLINDYKYFYDEFLKKSRLFTAYQLTQNEKINNSKIIDSLLNSNTESKQSTSEEKSENPNEKIIELIKAALDKVK